MRRELTRQMRQWDLPCQVALHVEVRVAYAFGASQDLRYRKKQAPHRVVMRGLLKVKLAPTYSRPFGLPSAYWASRRSSGRDPVLPQHYEHQQIFLARESKVDDSEKVVIRVRGALPLSYTPCGKLFACHGE